MATVYILYSETIDRFYIGSCKDLEFRIREHLDKIYPGSYTSKADDWQIFLLIEKLSYSQARSIEVRIKKMKSRTYIQNLVKYPEMIGKLKVRYA